MIVKKLHLFSYVVKNITDGMGIRVVHGLTHKSAITGHIVAPLTPIHFIIMLIINNRIGVNPFNIVFYRLTSHCLTAWDGSCLSISNDVDSLVI